MKSNPSLTTLKKIRLINGLTQKDMALKLNISLSMYSYIENGDKRLTYDIACKIADILKESPDKLFLKEYDDFFKNKDI